MYIVSEGGNYSMKELHCHNSYQGFVRVTFSCTFPFVGIWLGLGKFMKWKFLAYWTYLKSFPILDTIMLIIYPIQNWGRVSVSVCLFVCACVSVLSVWECISVVCALIKLKLSGDNRVYPHLILQKIHDSLHNKNTNKNKTTQTMH